MQQERNRVIEEMQEWKAKEENIANLFSPETLKTSYFQQLKLDHLKEMRKSVKNPSKEERMVLRILKGEMNLLERKLYPNRIERFFLRLVHVLKGLRNSGMKRDLTQQTNWMLKIDTAVAKASQQNKNGNTLKSVRQEKRERPILVQKNRISSKKSLRIK
jgi:hypothetical protein